VKPQARWQLPCWVWTCYGAWAGGTKQCVLSGSIPRMGPVKNRCNSCDTPPSLQKLYYHGEPLNVNVHVTNNSTKTVKKIKVSGRRWGWKGPWGRDLCISGFCSDLKSGHKPNAGNPPVTFSVPEWYLSSSVYSGAGHVSGRRR
jgi:hypothetical protein